VASVKLERVRKVYEGGVTAVHQISLDIQDREFVVLVGPSGCGKSTTLRMIAGLEEVTEGSIYIGDQRVNDVAPKDRDIAMVFQNYALYPHMTVYDNMAFGLKLRKYPKEEIKARVGEAAEILGIQELLGRKPKALSGGQRQRVAVGRAIVRKPKVFLFDEPLSNLDAKLRVQMRTEISKLHQKLGTTMIYVTHDQTEAMTMGDKIVLMKDGHVHQIDTPLNLYNHPVNKFVGGFIGSPSMNFFRGKVVRKKGLRFVEDGGAFELPVPTHLQKPLSGATKHAIIVGLRPEHIGLKSTGARRSKTAPVRATVEVVEPMGNEIYLYCTMRKDGEQFVARVATAKEPPVGKPIDLVFDLTNLHVFDAKTEERIG
jgi:multiple sugar transport system ATP-binding protein